MLEVLFGIIGLGFWCLLLLRSNRGSKGWLIPCMAGAGAGLSLYLGLHLNSFATSWVGTFTVQYLSIILLISGLLLFVLGVMINDSVPGRVLNWLWIPALAFSCLTGIGVGANSLGIEIKSTIVAAGVSAIYGALVLLLAVLPLLKIKGSRDSGLVPRWLGGIILAWGIIFPAVEQTSSALFHPWQLPVLPGTMVIFTAIITMLLIFVGFWQKTVIGLRR